jgi:rhodanese-related sulfurtransferase
VGVLEGIQYLQYLLFAFVLWVVLHRFLPVKGLENLSAEQVRERLKNTNEYVFVDVREAHEYKQGHIQGFKNIPLSQLTQRLREIDRDKAVILTCRSGMRSTTAAKILRKHGFTRIAHLKNGILSWHDPLVR